MGYPREKVIETYLLFDKDAQETANYLLDHGFEDEDDN